MLCLCKYYEIPRYVEVTSHTAVLLFFLFIWIILYYYNKGLSFIYTCLARQVLLCSHTTYILRIDQKQKEKTKRKKTKTVSNSKKIKYNKRTNKQTNSSNNNSNNAKSTNLLRRSMCISDKRRCFEHEPSRLVMETKWRFVVQLPYSSCCSLGRESR